MAKTPVPNTRILLEYGYNGKFLLPAGTSADQIAILANAIQVDDSYVSGTSYLHPTNTQKRISIRIIDSDEIKNFIDGRGDDHPDYDIIVSEVKKAIDGKPHAVLIFKSDCIKINEEVVDYEELANPATDPEDIIGKIVEMVLANPVTA